VIGSKPIIRHSNTSYSVDVGQNVYNLFEIVHAQVIFERMSIAHLSSSINNTLFERQFWRRLVQRPTFDCFKRICCFLKSSCYVTQRWLFHVKAFRVRKGYTQIDHPRSLSCAWRSTQGASC